MAPGLQISAEKLTGSQTRVRNQSLKFPPRDLFRVLACGTGSLTRVPTRGRSLSLTKMILLSNSERDVEWKIAFRDAVMNFNDLFRKDEFYP